MTGSIYGSKGNPMDILGIGANMVKALRYWLQAVKLTTEPMLDAGEQSFTPFGEIVFKNDPYIEEWERSGFYIICLHRIRTRQLPGTSSTMSSSRVSLTKKIL